MLTLLLTPLRTVIAQEDLNPATSPLVERERAVQYSSLEWEGGLRVRETSFRDTVERLQVRMKPQESRETPAAVWHRNRGSQAFTFEWAVANRPPRVLGLVYGSHSIVADTVSEFAVVAPAHHDRAGRYRIVMARKKGIHEELHLAVVAVDTLTHGEPLPDLPQPRTFLRTPTDDWPEPLPLESELELRLSSSILDRVTAIPDGDGLMVAIYSGRSSSFSVGSYPTLFLRYHPGTRTWKRLTTTEVPLDKPVP